MEFEFIFWTMDVLLLDHELDVKLCQCRKDQKRQTVTSSLHVRSNNVVRVCNLNYNDNNLSINEFLTVQFNYRESITVRYWRDGRLNKI